MHFERICLLYLSPTGGTERIGRAVAEALGRELDRPVEAVSFTTPKDREEERRFGPRDLLVMASPVYAGRLPNKLMPEYKAKIFGEGTIAVPICVFGNRSPDEALRELVLLLEGNGFQIAAGAAFPGRHAFSDQVGAGRPDEDDLAQIRDFAARTAQKLSGEVLPPLEMDRSEIGPYYIPLKEDMSPAKFLKAKPLTDGAKCLRCGLCARSCPVGSIDTETMEAAGLCIKCQACVRRCPVRAKYFEDPDFLSHVAMLEQNYARRADAQILI